MDRQSRARHLFTRLKVELDSRPFSPPWWLRGGRLQTVVSSLSRRNFCWGWPSSQEISIDLQDGSRINALCVWRSRSSPTLILLHGMGGSSASSYMQGLSHKAYREGWNSVLLNLYNRNDSRLPPKVFHSGCSQEVSEILERLMGKQQLGPLFLAGISMGGNILLKLLGEWGNSFPADVQGAAVISPLLDLQESCRLLEKPSNRFFQHHFVSGFKKRIRQGQARLERFVDVESLLKIRTVRQFDDLFTVPLGGFRDVADYYQQASAAHLLDRVRVPTLVIHSRDDPFLPSDPLTLSATRANPFLYILLTLRGGHVGFLEKSNNGDRDWFWAENRVIDYFRTVARFQPTPGGSQEP